MINKTIPTYPTYYIMIHFLSPEWEVGQHNYSTTRGESQERRDGRANMK